MSKNLEDVGYRIRIARKKLNYSQADLAEILQISPSYMSDIENGKTNIGLDIFMRLTETLQVSADWLLQTDTPIVNTMISSEVSEIFSNCTVREMKLYLNIVKEVKRYIESINE